MREATTRPAARAIACALAIGAAAHIATHATAQAAGGNGSSGSGHPCPISMEFLCDAAPASPARGSGPVLATMCDCGPGNWIRTLPQVATWPLQPLAEINTPVSINGTSWTATREASAQACSAEVHVAGYGTSGFWRAGSLTRSAAARYSYSQRELWQGPGIPCPRMVTLAASGGAGLTLTLTCSAQKGCGASGTSSVSGVCSSLGNASASVDNKKVEGSVAFDASSESTEIEGHFGAQVDDSSASVKGRISRTENWSVKGAGNVSGSASYTVKEDRTYCAFTNRAVTKLATGVAICSAGATVDNNGSAAFDARAFISLCVN